MAFLWLRPARPEEEKRGGGGGRSHFHILEAEREEEEVSLLSLARRELERLPPYFGGEGRGGVALCSRVSLSLLFFYFICVRRGVRFVSFVGSARLRQGGFFRQKNGVNEPREEEERFLPSQLRLFSTVWDSPKLV